MFFSLGFDVKDHYKDFGGDYAAYMAPVLIRVLVIHFNLISDLIFFRFMTYKVSKH